MKQYIHQLKDWPQFIWGHGEILYALGKVRYLQGKLMGKMETFGFALREEAMLETLTLDISKSSEIEGEILSREHLRSSIPGV